MTTVDFDKLAIEQAELKLHALFGKHLMADLHEKYYREGAAVAASGRSADELWNESQRAGYRTTRMMHQIIAYSKRVGLLGVTQ